MLQRDTDSFMYKIETEEDLYKGKNLFVFCNYPQDSKYYNDANNLVVGKMKEKASGVPIEGFKRLKSKVKGINKNFVDDELKYEDYKNIFFNRSYMKHEMNRIQSKNHSIGLYRINKISLSSHDDKNIYLKMDIVDYHSFINVLVNHIKNNFRQI